MISTCGTLGFGRGRVGQCAERPGLISNVEPPPGDGTGR